MGRGVTSRMINTGAITARILKDLAVDTADIAASAITAAKIAAGAVETAKVADAAITAAKLADDAVTTAKILDANVTEAKLATHDVLLPIGLPETWGVDVDPMNTGLIGCNMTSTEMGADYAWAHDASGNDVLLNATSGDGAYTNDYQVFPDTPANDDAVYFGVDNPRPLIGFDVSATTGAYSASGGLTTEYWDGSAWQTLTLKQDGTSSSNDSFEQDGNFCFVPPSDWTASSLGPSSQEAYWIRVRVTDATKISTVAILTSEHLDTTPGSPWTAPRDMTWADLRLVSGASTLGSTADTKFFIWNFTKHEGSAEKTWTKGTRAASWSSLALNLDSGDELALIVTQEDGTNEHVNVQGEIGGANR